MKTFALALAALCFLACGGHDSGGTGGGTATGGAGSGGAGGGSSAAGGGSSASGGGSSAAGGGSSAAGGGSVSATGQWVLGYYVGYQVNDYPIAQIDWSGLSHIAFAPLLLKTDLSLDFGFEDQNGTGMADAIALATAAHAHHVVPLLMLGGAGAGSRIAQAAASGKRAAFVTALVTALTTLGYDGIDLDWEDSVNLDDLVALAQALRAAKPDIVLSYPGGVINSNIDTVSPKLVTLAQSLDRFNIQSYYPSTAVAGQGWDSWFNSPLSGKSGSTPIAIDDSFQRYVAAGIPKSKLGMGIAFYAICYTGGITGPRQPTTGSTQIVGGDNNLSLSTFFKGGGAFASATAAEVKLDATAQVPYLSLAAATNVTGCGSTRYVSYEDEASIIAKGTWSKTNGYGGIIIWTIQQGWLPANAAGGRAPNALMQALKTGFLQ